jgi:hypothetical protein
MFPKKFKILFSLLRKRRKNKPKNNKDIIMLYFIVNSKGPGINIIIEARNNKKSRIFLRFGCL